MRNVREGFDPWLLFFRVRRMFVLLVYAVLALCGVAALLLYQSSEHFLSFGAAPDGEFLQRVRASKHFIGGRFENSEPTSVMQGGLFMASANAFLFGREMREPSCPLPYVRDTAARLAKKSVSGLRITWLGHSTTLIEIDGVVILTDPMWSERASPSTLFGPKRFLPPPLAIDDLPKLDAVLISHEHFDHLDMNSVRRLAVRGATFHVPLGIGAHLSSWGVADAQIVEQDWWDEKTLRDELRIVSTPARHFNGRGVPGRIGTSWTSWSIIGPQHRVFFSGDTGYTKSFADIAQRYGPFDVALLEIGHSHPSWGDIHLGPVGALQANDALDAKVLLPIHWGTFNLSYHAWSEPAETLTRSAAKLDTLIATPLVGEPFEPSIATSSRAWWRALPPIAASCPAQ